MMSCRRGTGVLYASTLAYATPAQLLHHSDLLFVENASSLHGSLAAGRHYGRILAAIGLHMERFILRSAETLVSNRTRVLCRRVLLSQIRPKQVLRWIRSYRLFLNGAARGFSTICAMPWLLRIWYGLLLVN